MYTQTQVFFMNCETALHAGAGEGSGGIDNPIQREKTTQFPKIESSGVKGAIKDAYRLMLKTQAPANSLDKDEFKLVFGNDDNGDQHSAIAFDDAKILLFPVRSAKGVFSWITSARALYRFQLDLSRLGDFENIQFIDLKNDLKNNEIQVFSNSLLNDKKQAIFEEYLFQKTDDRVPKITVGKAQSAEATNTTHSISKFLADIVYPINENPYWNMLLSNQLAIVSDEMFRNIVLLHTEVRTRNKINPETGTADGGKLFVDEHVPTNALFYTICGIMDPYIKPMTTTSLNATKITDKMEPFWSNRIIQLGGNYTIGKGLLRLQNISKIFKTKTLSNGSTKPNE